MLYDPNFRKEEARYFPADSTDRRIEWRNEHPGYDLYEPRSAACQLRVSLSFLRYSIRHDQSAPVAVGRGTLAMISAKILVAVLICASPAGIGDQAGENLGADVALVFGECAVSPTVVYRGEARV